MVVSRFNICIVWASERRALALDAPNFPRTPSAGTLSIQQTPSLNVTGQSTWKEPNIGDPTAVALCSTSVALLQADCRILVAYASRDCSWIFSITAINTRCSSGSDDSGEWLPTRFSLERWLLEGDTMDSSSNGHGPL